MDTIERTKVGNECIKLLDLFRKMLIDENRLLCELRDRGAECISCNIAYSSDNPNFFRDLEGNTDDGGVIFPDGKKLYRMEV